MNTQIPSTPHDTSPHTAALFTGLALLTMAILAPIAAFGVIENLRVPGDTEATAALIRESASLFRIATVMLLLVAILDVIVAWGLYLVLKPVNRSISLLGAWFRLVYTAIFGVGIVNLLHTLIAAQTDPARTLFFLRAFDLTWQAGLVIFGIHLLVVGGLSWRSGYIPRLLGALLLLAGAGYLFDGIAALLSDSAPFAVSSITFIGEVLFIFWLLFRGQRIPAIE